MNILAIVNQYLGMIPHVEKVPYGAIVVPAVLALVGLIIFLAVKRNSYFLTKHTSRSYDFLCLPKILQFTSVCPCAARHRPEYFVVSLMGDSFINRMCHEKCLSPRFWGEFFSWHSSHNDIKLPPLVKQK